MVFLVQAIKIKFTLHTREGASLPTMANYYGNNETKYGKEDTKQTTQLVLHLSDSEDLPVLIKSFPLPRKVTDWYIKKSKKEKREFIDLTDENFDVIRADYILTMSELFAKQVRRPDVLRHSVKVDYESSTFQTISNAELERLQQTGKCADQPAP